MLMKQLIINNKKTQDFYSDDVSEESIRNRVVGEYGNIKYSLKKVNTVRATKYNFHPLLSGKTVIINLPEKPTIRNGRKVEETNSREAAYRFAKNNGFKVTIVKSNDKLIIKTK